MTVTYMMNVPSGTVDTVENWACEMDEWEMEEFEQHEVVAEFDKLVVVQRDESGEWQAAEKQLTYSLIDKHGNKCSALGSTLAEAIKEAAFNFDVFVDEEFVEEEGDFCMWENPRIKVG